MKDVDRIFHSTLPDLISLSLIKDSRIETKSYLSGKMRACTWSENLRKIKQITIKKLQLTLFISF